MDDAKNISRETSFAQRKPQKVQQLARICCWNCNEYGHYQCDCPQKKKMHGTKMSEVEEDQNEDRIASAQSCKMGLQVLNPAQGCNGQARPRVALHGNENHEWSNSAFFLAEKSKECVGSMCHTIEQTDRQGYPNCEDYLNRTVAIPQ
jgi:hypothetical protein